MGQHVDFEYFLAIIPTDPLSALTFTERDYFTEWGTSQIQWVETEFKALTTETNISF